MEAAISRPQIFRYQDYRTYLKGFFAFLNIYPASEKFTYRSFSKTAGFKSPGFIKAAIQGKKNFSDESIHKLARALELSNSEKEFLINLVHFNQNTDLDHRLMLANRLIVGRANHNISTLDRAFFDLYKEWYCVPILVLIGTKILTKTPLKLQPPLTQNLGRESISHYKSHHREISCATIAVDRENFDQVKKLVQNFRKQIMEL